MKWKKVGLVGLCLMVGFVLGYIYTLAWKMPSMAKMTFMLQEKEIVEHEEAVVQAYYDQPNDVAVWALVDYINTLNKLKKERGSTGVENPYFLINPDSSLVLAHTRLGQLYKKMDNHEKSGYHFEQAFSYSKLAKLKNLNTKEDLLALLARIDEHRDSNSK